MTDRLRIAALLYLLAQTLVLGLLTLAAAAVPASGDVLALAPLAVVASLFAIVPAAWALAPELASRGDPSPAARSRPTAQGRAAAHRGWHPPSRVRTI